jgi:Tol biopolymer transport system component
MRSVPAADHLSLANGADGTLLVEAADAHGSRIVRSSDGATVVDDGESPSLSADAQRVVYIREVKGRGTLRLLELSGKNDFELIRNGQEEYDVRQAAFAGDDRVLFAAKYKGRVSLFTVGGDGTPNAFFAAEGDVGGFAISPDALHIVFTELLEDRWQLALLDIETGKARTLTHNDCNAYEPTWRAEDEIVYATDCGRGLGLTALAKMQVTL